MAEGDQMPKIDLKKDKPLLNATTQEWMKFIEKENRQRVEKLRVLRKRNLLTGIFLGATVVSIYTYSILAVKQETFLDDFEEPKIVKIEDKVSA